MCDHILNICEHDVLINRFWELYQIYNLSAVGDKDELIRFQCQKVKGQHYSRTRCGQISTWEAFSNLSLDCIFIFQ